MYVIILSDGSYYQRHRDGWCGVLDAALATWFGSVALAEQMARVKQVGWYDVLEYRGGAVLPTTAN